MERGQPPAGHDGKVVARGVLLRPLALGLAVVHQPRYCLHRLVQGAAEGHVELLEAATDAEQRQAEIEGGGNPGQGGGIPIPVVAGILRGPLGAVAPRRHVGVAAGEQQPIEVGRQVAGHGILPDRQDHRRQAVLAQRGQVLVGDHVGRMALHLATAGDHAHQGSGRHGALLSVVKPDVMLCST